MSDKCEQIAEVQRKSLEFAIDILSMNCKQHQFCEGCVFHVPNTLLGCELHDRQIFMWLPELVTNHSEKITGEQEISSFKAGLAQWGGVKHDEC